MASKRKLFFFAALFLSLASPVQAQNIKDNIRQTDSRKAKEAAEKREREKAELEWKREQQRLEQEERQRQAAIEKERREAAEREQARIKRGQVSLSEQIQILKTQDINAIDNMLRDKGLTTQAIQENGSDFSIALSWAFDKKPYSNSAVAWCYLITYTSNYNRKEFRYQYSNEDQYQTYLADLNKNGFKNISSDIVNDGIRNIWKNNDYSVTIIKSTNQENNRNVTYSVAIYNYRRELEIAEKERQERQEQETKERKLYEERISKAKLSLDDVILLSQLKNIDTISQFLLDKGWKCFSRTTVKMEELVFSGKQFAYELSEDLKLPVDYIKVNVFDNFAYDNIIEYQTNAGKFSIQDISNADFSVSNSGLHEITTGNENENENILKQSTYRNTLYELIVTEHIKDDNASENGYFTNYEHYFLFNINQLETRKEILEQQRREELARLARYNELVAQAESAELSKDYRKAKYIYEQALSIRNNIETLNERIKKVDIEILLKESDSLSNAKQYVASRTKLMEAKNITPNHRMGIINSRLEELNQIQSFLSERTHSVFDYETENNGLYHFYNDSILTALKHTIISNTEHLPLTRFDLTCNIDTFGQTTPQYNLLLENIKLSNSIDELFQNIKLEPYVKNNYIVMSKADFSYNIGYQHAVVDVKKNQKGIFSKHSDFLAFKPQILSQISSVAPYAKYTFDIHKMDIDGRVDLDCKLTDMHILGGPTNALLSLLVPGLGDHRVTYGKRKGVGTAVLTYTFVGAGAGILLYDHYRGFDVNFNKNLLTYGAYTSLAIGGVIWLTDIIWVAAKGAKNKKEFNEYKKSHLNAYYDPFTQSKGISYSMSF